MSSVAGPSLGAPVFVFGAPRSGTTYFTEVLNCHSQVFITNEARVMTFINRILNRLAKNEWVLWTHRDEFLDHLGTELPGMIERFYQDLGAGPGVRWGDKNPHYADAKTDPDCLATIDFLFPGAQYLNIIRDGREVVASITSKGWVDIEEAVDVWRRHVLHARAFERLVGPDRMITLRYERLLWNGVDLTARVLSWLGLDMEEEVESFLRGQAKERSPFSRPTVDSAEIGVPRWRQTLSPDDARLVEASLAELLTELGYEF